MAREPTKNQRNVADSIIAYIKAGYDCNKDPQVDVYDQVTGLIHLEWYHDYVPTEQFRKSHGNIDKKVFLKFTIDPSQKITADTLGRYGCSFKWECLLEHETIIEKDFLMPMGIWTVIRDFVEGEDPWKTSV